MRVLLVEDDALIADAIEVTFRREGFHVDWVADGLSAEEALASSAFDLVLLDLGLPGQDGITLLRWLRGQGGHNAQGKQIPVIILTAREAVENRIEGLDLGADDYMVKPFDMQELMARARAMIRRANGRAVPALEIGDIILDPAARTLRKDNTLTDLPPLAFQVLQVLLERRGRVVSKDDLAQVLYGWDDGAESNTVEVYISQIRRRLGTDLIRTIRGIGYVIDQ